MAEKSVIVELDFAVLPGSEILYATSRDFLADLDGIDFDPRLEAKHFAGRDMLAALTGYFALVKTKKTALKASKDLPAAFIAALNDAMSSMLTPGLKNFVKALTDRDVKVVFATRASAEIASQVLAPILSDKVHVYQDASPTYGCMHWDAWRRVCRSESLSFRSCVAVVGSGVGVKGVLHAGIPVVAVTNKHVAYQDFSGADDVVNELNAAAAKSILTVLHVS